HDEQREQAEVEDDVADLPRVAALGGQLDGAGDAAVAIVAADPALELATDLGRGLLRRGRGPVRGVVRQAGQVARGQRRGRAQLADQLEATRGEAADQRDEQQDVDG